MTHKYSKITLETGQYFANSFAKLNLNLRSFLAERFPSNPMPYYSKTKPWSRRQSVVFAVVFAVVSFIHEL